MTTLAKKEGDKIVALKDEDKISVLGCDFELIRSGDWRGVMEAQRTIKLPGGEVCIDLDLAQDTKTGEIKVSDITQAVIGFEITDPSLHTGDNHTDRLIRIMGATSNMPMVGLSVLRVDKNTRFHLTQRLPIGQGNKVWQEFDFEVDAGGIVVNGWGSADIFNDVTNRDGTETDFFDLSPEYDPEKLTFVGVDFGEGAMAKLLKKFGLPTNFQSGAKAVDETEKPLVFDNVATRIISLTSQKIEAELFLESGVHKHPKI